MTEEEKSEQSAAATTTEGEGGASPVGHEAQGQGADAHAAPAAPADRFSPEAIAERIDHVGTETPQEREEREADEKLVARRKEGGDKRSALEIAASKRLSEIGEKTVRRPTQAVVLNSEMEPLRGPLKWYEENKRLVQGVAVAAVVLVFGGVAVKSWQDSQDTAASVALSAAISAEHGHIEGEKGDSRDQKDDLRPMFKSAAERTDSAIAKYREVEKAYARSGAATMARLAEGSLLLDKGDADGALAAFQEVRESTLAKADTEIKGRALEGIGFAYERKAESEPAKKTDFLEQALSAYTDLEGLDVKGLKELGEYHEARVREAKGDTAGAIEKLKQARAAVGEPSQKNVFSYLQFAVEDRLRALSPSDVPPPKRSASGLGGLGGSGPGGLDMNDPAVQKMVQQYMEQMKKQGGKPPAPGAPAP